MDNSQIEPEEMERRHNKDFIASLKMIGEGGPVYDSIEQDWDKEVKVKKNVRVIINNQTSPPCEVFFWNENHVSDVLIYI